MKYLPRNSHESAIFDVLEQEGHLSLHCKSPYMTCEQEILCPYARIVKLSQIKLCTIGTENYKQSPINSA